MLTQETLREFLDYDAEIGIFRWKITRPGGLAYAGSIAGRTARGHKHIQIKVGGRLYLAHRLAWLFVNGEWPHSDLQIDHINGDRFDNRIVNLRLATQSQNNANTAPKSGFKGVSRHKDGKWQARICALGRHYHLGLFDDQQTAHSAYQQKAVELFGEFARWN